MKSSIQYRGGNLTYLVQGKGRTIVLLHGFLGAKEIWKKYIPRLSKHFKVVVPDLPGHGESECIGYVHNMELLAEGIKALLIHLNIRKVVLAGHSLGGYVSLAFSEKYPDSVLGLVLLNSTARGDSAKRLKSRNQLIELVKKDRKRAIGLLVPTFFNIKRRYTHLQIKSYLKMAHKCDEQAIIATIEGMKNRKEREIVLKFAPFPFLFIIGEEDSILQKEDLIKQARLSIKGAYEVIENSSHMSLLEKEENVFKALKTFAKKSLS